MVKREELEVGTIAISRDGRIAIVTEIKPNNTKYPIIYSFKTEARGYKGNEDDFTAILGIGDVDVWNEHKPAPKPRVQGTDKDWAVPPELKGIKIGDEIKIRTRRGTETAIYQGYNSRRPKFPVSFTNSKGRDMKGTLSIIVGKADG